MKNIIQRPISMVLSCVVLTVILNATAYSANIIDWELENGFRMFLKSEHTQLHRNEYENLTDEEKKNPVLSLERKLSMKFRQGWAKDVFNFTCWNPRKRTYARCRGRKKDYLHPKSHKVIARLTSSQIKGKCRWIIRDNNKDGAKIFQEVQAFCKAPVKFNVPYPQGGNISVIHNDKVISRTEIKVKDLFIVGIGDSFASGEGNPDSPVKFTDRKTADYGIIVGTGIKLENFPAREGRWRWIADRRFARKKAYWQSEACHRSLYSHQLRAALQLVLEDKKLAVTYAGFSCSGAEMLVGLLDRYKGNLWVKYPPKDSQISSAVLAMCGPNKAVPATYTTTYTYRGYFPSLENLSLYKCDRRDKKYRKIDFLLMSIGGNDVGFSRLVANAILKDKTVLKSLGGWFGQIYTTKEAEAGLSELKMRYKAINRAIHNSLYIPWSEADRIILTAYPKIGYREDGTTLCPNGNTGMDLHPVFKVNSKKVLDGELFSFKLTNTMRKTAHAFGWSFVEAHRAQFSGHGYCAGYGGNSNTQDESFYIPKKTSEGWVPYKPSEYRAYYPRQRWIRTPNDVFMGTHQHVDRSLVRKVLKLKNLNAFQLIFAGTYGGSFHPTAEGQAAIADAVVNKMRGLLKKYK